LKAGERDTTWMKLRKRLTNRIKTTKPRADEPVVRMENVEDAFVHGCRALPGTGSFLELSGESTRGIVLAGNHLVAAENCFTLKKGAREEAVVQK